VSKWPGKYVIGLTGNIATGKSVVRKMLEHLGAYGIDADALSHRVIARGGPGHQPVLSAFGNWVLNADGEIDRQKLGRLVFSEPEALGILEGIIHPYVDQAINLLVQRSRQATIVIEAIKLFESNLAVNCDSLWTTVASESIQLARLMSKRGMSKTEALNRIRMQLSQQEKVAKASVLIQNSGSFEETWRQVQAAWKKFIPRVEPAPLPAQKPARKDLVVQRGRPGDSRAIAELITRLSKGVHRKTAEEIMAAFGEKAFLLLKQEHQLVGLVAWQVENLVARSSDIYVDADLPLALSLKALVNELERGSRDLQCEASLLFLPPALAIQADIWHNLGYETRTPQSLGIQAWQDAVKESMPVDTVLFFKQLRIDRVLRPI